MTSDELAGELCKFGAITSIEAPTIDTFVEAQKEEKGLNNDYFSKQRQLKKDRDYRYAQVVLAEAQEVDKQVADLMQETWGEEKAKEMIN